MTLRNHYLITFLLTLAVYGVVYFSSPVEWQSVLFRLDKVGHFWGFFFLSMIVFKLINLAKRYLMICLILYSGGTELGQEFLGFRNGTFQDFYADAAGVIAFFVLYAVSQKLFPNQETPNLC